MNKIGHIDIVKIQTNLEEMKSAFQTIMDGEEGDYDLIEIGLEALQNLAEFFSNATQHQMIGRFKQKNIEEMKKIDCLKQFISQSIFIHSDGRFDLTEEFSHIQRDKAIEAAETALKSNKLGKLILCNLEEELLEPVSKMLTEPNLGACEELPHLANMDLLSDLEKLNL